MAKKRKKNKKGKAAKGEVDLSNPRPVTIDGVEYKVVLPDYAVTRELTLAVHVHPIRGYAAIIGMCCPGFELKDQYVRHHYDPLAFGGSVMETLFVDHDLGEMDLFKAGKAIYPALLVKAFPGEAEVAEHEDFSQAPEEE